VIVGNGSRQTGVRRLDAAPEATPEIDLPAGIETSLIVGESFIRSRRKIGAVFADPDTRCGTKGLLGLWILITDGDAKKPVMSPGRPCM
jgi:hypothetical protein